MKKKSTEEVINNVNATMAMEDMPLTEEDKQRLRDCMDGKTTVSAEVEKIKEKYRKQVL